MMRSSGYNRFGVLMGTSWPASCPRSHRLQGDFSPMITLILLQRAFCATAHRGIIVDTMHDTKRIVLVVEHTSGHVPDVSYDSVVEAGPRLDSHDNTTAFR